MKLWEFLKLNQCSMCHIPYHISFLCWPAWHTKSQILFKINIISAQIFLFFIYLVYFIFLLCHMQPFNLFVYFLFKFFCFISNIFYSKYKNSFVLLHEWNEEEKIINEWILWFYVEQYLYIRCKNNMETFWIKRNNCKFMAYYSLYVI